MTIVVVSLARNDIRVYMRDGLITLDRVQRHLPGTTWASIRERYASRIDLMDDERRAEDIPAGIFHHPFKFVKAIDVAEDISMSLRLRDGEGERAPLGHELSPSFGAVVIAMRNARELTGCIAKSVSSHAVRWVSEDDIKRLVSSTHT